MHQTDNTIDKTSTSVLKSFLVTTCEASILDAAAHIGFGDLLAVEIPTDQKAETTRNLSANQIAFVSALRTGGLSFLDVIIIHNGMPSQIEILGQFAGIKYRRKIRFH